VPELRAEPGIELVTDGSRLASDRWYELAPTTALLADQVRRAIAQRRLFDELLRRHRDDPYDVYYQFSQLELAASGAQRRQLPPLVLHPQVHATGERRWLWNERALLDGRGAKLRASAMASLLSARVPRQQRSLDLATVIIAPSQAFAGDLRRDHAVPPEKVHVIPNPIDLSRFPVGAGTQTGPVRLLFVSYLAVRKGLELVVELSRRLRDLRGRVELVVVGAPRMWSDYRPLLAGLDPLIGRYAGAPEPDELPRWFAEADAVLQPSRYEPFGLTVGEALASGACVAASDVVGAAENLPESCLWPFRDGDIGAFEAAVRSMVDDLERDRRSRRVLARSAATRLFGADVVSAQLAEALATIPTMQPPRR
jgi:glycosyltransferase involved in cell wall biosynthesis